MRLDAFRSANAETIAGIWPVLMPLSVARLVICVMAALSRSSVASGCLDDYRGIEGHPSRSP